MRKTKKRGRIASSNHNWSDAPLYITFDGFSLFLLTLEHFRPNELRIGINKVEKEPKRAWNGTKKDRPTPSLRTKLPNSIWKPPILWCCFAHSCFFQLIFIFSYHGNFVHRFWSFSLVRNIYLILLHFFLIPYFFLFLSYFPCCGRSAGRSQAFVLPI